MKKKRALFITRTVIVEGIIQSEVKESHLRHLSRLVMAYSDLSEKYEFILPFLLRILGFKKMLTFDAKNDNHDEKIYCI